MSTNTCLGNTPHSAILSRKIELTLDIPENKVNSFMTKFGHAFDFTQVKYARLPKGETHGASPHDEFTTVKLAPEEEADFMVFLKKFCTDNELPYD